MYIVMSFCCDNGYGKIKKHWMQWWAEFKPWPRSVDLRILRVNVNIESFSNTTRILRARGTIYSQLKQTEFWNPRLGAKHIKRELIRELTETRDFFYIKNTCWILYRVFRLINLHIKTISLCGHFLDFRSRCYYFLVPLSWAGETIVFIWYWCSSLSVVNRSRVGWKRSLFACK